MIFPGQTLGGSADGKQKKFISTFDDDPYGDYMKKMNIQPNPANPIGGQPMAKVGIPNPGGGDIPDGGPDMPGDPGGGGENGNGGTEIFPGTPTFGAPTIDELMNLDAGDLGNLFGKGVEGYTEERFLAKYGMYIPEYDPYQQKAREKEYSLTAGGMRDEALLGKERIANQFRSMSSNFNQEQLKDRLIGAASNQFDLANVRKKQDVRSFQEQYYGDVMETMGMLGQLGAFDSETYEGESERNETNWTEDWDDGNPGDQKLDRRGMTWYWNQHTGKWQQSPLIRDRNG